MAKSKGTLYFADALVIASLTTEFLGLLIAVLASACLLNHFSFHILRNRAAAVFWSPLSKAAITSFLTCGLSDGIFFTKFAYLTPLLVLIVSGFILPVPLSALTIPDAPPTPC